MTRMMLRSEFDKISTMKQLRRARFETDVRLQYQRRLIVSRYTLFGYGVANGLFEKIKVVRRLIMGVVSIIKWIKGCKAEKER